MQFDLKHKFFSGGYASLCWKFMCLIACLTGITSVAFAQPANDDPCNAIPLTVGTTCNYVTYTNANATASAGVPAPGCANYQGGDVWFTVTVPASGNLNFDSQTGVITDAGMAIYSGTCTALTLIECDDDDSPNGAMSAIQRTGLTPGSTIWIRMWEFGNNNNGTFGICVLEPPPPPPPPANDNPCGAILIPVRFDSCSYTTYTNATATATPNIPAPGCANYAGGDVWFKFVVPCTGSVNLDTQTGVVTDGGMAIYSAVSCNGPFTLITCDDDGSANGLMPSITRTGLTPGDTIYIRFWEYGNNSNGTFGLCASVPQAGGPASSCATASAFCASTTPTTFPNITNQPSLGGGGVYGCLASTPNPAFFYLQINQSGNIDITISQAANNGNPIDVDFVVWGPFNNLSAACGGISASNIVDCSFSIAAVEIANIPNAVAGQYYLMLVTNFNGAAGSITYQQTGGNGGTNCGLQCNVNATNSGPVCAGSTFNLFSSTVAGATYSWTGPNCFTSSLQNPTNVSAGNIPGTYIYTVTVTGPGGVNCSDTTRVTVLAAPNVGADTTLSICNGSTRNLTNIYNSTGLTVAYSFNGTPVNTPASVNVSGIYSLIFTNAGGCKDTALVNLRVDTVKFTLATTNSTCTQPGRITASNASGIGPITYAISTAPTVFQTSPVFNVPAGTYSITAKDSLNCTTTQQVTVSQTNDLVLNGSPDQTICVGQSVTLNTTSNATAFSWSPAAGLSNPNIASPVASPAATTNYVLTATLGTCTKTDAVLVTVQPGVFVNAGPDLLIVSGETGTLEGSATGGTLTSIMWSPTTGLTTPNQLRTLVTPAANSGTTVYTLTVSNSLGCTASDNATVTVIPYCIKVANAFTPNGDGQNDQWQVYDSYQCLQNVTVTVFNRYGNKVYENFNYRNGWDGKYKGQDVPDGTYYAVITFKLIGGRTFTMRSDLTILR